MWYLYLKLNLSTMFLLFAFDMFLRFHWRCCFNLLSIGLVRDGLNKMLGGNRTNVYEHVYMVHGHDWRTVCSVCATGARVAQPSLCNS